MTIQQLHFLDRLLTIRLHKGRRHVRGIKSHRACWFMPAWVRDGYKSEVHYYHDRAPVADKLAALADPKHPNHDLAKAAEEMKL